MGYYADYHLEIAYLGEGDPPQDLTDRLTSEPISPSLSPAINVQYVLEGKLTDTVAFDTDGEDLAALSRKYPQFLFVMTFYGSRRDDIQKLYAHQGRVEVVYAKLIWPEPRLEFLTLLPKPWNS